MEITLKLELNEVNAVLDIMGQMPTSTNVWPLAAKIRAMAEAQLSKPVVEPALEEGSGLTD